MTSLGIGRCVDFRYEAGFPTPDQALAQGIPLVRCISLPDMEYWAGRYQQAGIPVLSVYTGESEAAGQYVMQNCMAMIVGNEPQYAYPEHGAAWPAGSLDDYIGTSNHIADVVVPSKRPGLPLLGAGFWAHDYNKWAQAAPYLHGLSGACVHVYPIATGNTPTTVKTHLGRYKAVRPDLPLLCTEATFRGRALEYKRAILAHCEALLWYGPLDNPEVHGLEGTAEYGPLLLSRS